MIQANQEGNFYFHPIDDEAFREDTYAISDVTCDQIMHTYPVMVCPDFFSTSECHENHISENETTFTLRTIPNLNPYFVESFRQLSSGILQAPPQLIKFPFYELGNFDEIHTSLYGHPERLWFKVSPLTINVHQNKLVQNPAKAPFFHILGIPIGSHTVLRYNKMERVKIGEHHFMMSEVVNEKLPKDIALQYAYCLTFAKYYEMTHTFCIIVVITPHGLTREIVDYFKLGPNAVYMLFRMLKFQILKPSENTNAKTTHIGGQIIMNEHPELSISSIDERTVYYYGCWNNRTGHFLFKPDGTFVEMESEKRLAEQMKSVNISCDIFISSSKCPQRKDVNNRRLEVEGEAHLHHINGWTLLAFWNRSVDHRNSSHSNFFTQGEWDFNQMCQIARKSYPSIWQKLDENRVKVGLSPQ